MRILKFLIVLILIIATIAVSNGLESINDEEVDTTKTVKPVVTKKPVIETIEESPPTPVIPAQTKTPTKTTEQTLPPKQTVAANDVPTYKPVYTKSPNFEPLTSLPPTMPPPKTAKPTTIATKEPVVTTPPVTQAPITTPPETDAPQTTPPKNTQPSTVTKAPAATQPPKASDSSNSFQLETTHVPVIPTKKPKSNAPTNSIPTFSESSYGLGDLGSNDSSNSISIFNNFKSIFTILSFIISITILFI